MQVSVLDLRYKINDVLKALERNEEVTLIYCGRIKGTIVPAKREEDTRMADHPFFGMSSGEYQKTVPDTLTDLRKTRLDDL